jgi:hypothetical protein
MKWNVHKGLRIPVSVKSGQDRAQSQIVTHQVWQV